MGWGAFQGEGKAYAKALWQKRAGHIQGNERGQCGWGDPMSCDMEIRLGFVK